MDSLLDGEKVISLRNGISEQGSSSSWGYSYTLIINAFGGEV